MNLNEKYFEWKVNPSVTKKVILKADVDLAVEKLKKGIIKDFGLSEYGIGKLHLLFDEVFGK